MNSCSCAQQLHAALLVMTEGDLDERELRRLSST